MVLNLLLVAIVALYGISALALYLLKSRGPCTEVRQWSEISAWIALFLGVLWSFQSFTTSPTISTGYFLNGPLQALLVPYILLMGLLVKRFAYHYLQTDADYPLFFLKIKLLIASLLLFVLSNHALITVGCWMFSGVMMYFLIGHVKTPAAINSARMALNRFLLGDLFLVIGVTGLINLSDSLFLSDWYGLAAQPNNLTVLISLLFVSIGAFSKTAIIPFHKWLVHTLVAPTPVSAIMHAGFVNAGAVLFAKIAPLLASQPVVLAFILFMGLVSALYGSSAMLVQSDVKRYLTFSTVGQMGFMMMECGLGAFHLAIFHLVVHGFFKARLFLSAGSVIEFRQAIRDVKSEQAQRAREQINVSQRLKTAGIIAGSVAVSWLLLLQIEALRNLVTQLPSLLLSVLVLSSLFIQTTIIKTKGSGFKGLSIATLFSVLLVGSYLIYEWVAIGALPIFHQATVSNPPMMLALTNVAFLTAGLLAWLATLNLLPIPTSLKEKCYVLLLNAAGGNPQRSTFSARF